MALAENHRTALKMEATCIAAATVSNPGDSPNAAGEYPPPPSHPHHQIGLASDSGNRCRHQYSDMLDQVYTSHMHAKFQLQQHHVQQQQQQQHQQQQQQQIHQQHHKMFAQHQNFIASPDSYSSHLSSLEQFTTPQKDKVSIPTLIFSRISKISGKRAI